MIIHEPILSNENGRAVVSVRIDMKTCLPNYPDTLWFSYPEEYTSWISTRSDGFLAGLLIPAMFFGEDIHVEGEVSPKLAYRLPEYQFYNYKMRPDLLHEIKVTTPNLIPQPCNPDRNAVVVNFSGGIDSQFSFWSHLSQNQPIPQYLITHALHIHGFDIRLREKTYYEYTLKHFSKLCQENGIFMIPVSTNIFLFSELRIRWSISHSAALIGLVLSLGNLVRTYYKPSAEPWGYSGRYSYHGGEISDPFLSTDYTEIIHHGNPFTRKEKLEYLFQFPSTYSTLRVCSIPHRAGEQLNCSRCEKCLRTMILLKIKGYDHAYTTFKQPFRYRYIFTWWLLAKKITGELKRMIQFSKQEKRLFMVLILELLVIPGYLKDKLIVLMLSFIQKPTLYRLKTRLFPSDTYDHDGKRMFDFL